MMQSDKKPPSANQNGSSGHRKRLRDKFLHGGGRALYDYEKLELLLTYCIPRRDVKPLAKALLNKFESFNNLMNASIDEITSVSGISENSAALILLVKELCGIYLEEKMNSRPTLETLDHVVNFARMKIGGSRNEAYMVLCLNARNHLTHYECFQHGSVDRTLVDSREMVKIALKQNASAIVIIHNHPSGICLPSENDLRGNLKIVQALNAINVKLYDHIIVSGTDYYSMAAHKELPRQNI